jgi:hypothetical protein
MKVFFSNSNFKIFLSFFFNYLQKKNIIFKVISALDIFFKIENQFFELIRVSELIVGKKTIIIIRVGEGNCPLVALTLTLSLRVRFKSRSEMILSIGFGSGSANS